MRVIKGRNVNHVLPIAVMMLRQVDCARLVAPRNNEETLEIITPVCTVYEEPLERVLFEPRRDANPFFHLFEALWILAGRDDVRWLAYFLPRMREYSDDGKVFHGAYGARMRALTIDGNVIDQLGSAIEQLRASRLSRRAVVALWQPEFDSGYNGKDMPCNCTITFKVRDDRLHMHVFNRSNDMVWGAYGANVVQFSTIMEYVAGMLGLPVGTYYQTSDSFHAYVRNDAWMRLQDMGLQVIDPYRYPANWYSSLSATTQRVVEPYPMVKVQEIFDTELHHFVNYADDVCHSNHRLMARMGYENPYFDDVAIALLNAFVSYKRGNYTDAMCFAHSCGATDWQLAARNWLHRRLKAKEQADA